MPIEGESGSLEVYNASETKATIDADWEADTSPSNTGNPRNPSPGAWRAIRCGGAGNIKVTYLDGTVDTITDLVAGEYIYGKFAMIWDTGTTVTKVTAFK
jgi:hypothetical protein